MCVPLQVPLGPLVKPPDTRYPEPGYLVPCTCYPVPGMYIVPGTRKHACATAGASWNSCESSRCPQLHYVLPLTLFPAFSLSSDEQTSWKSAGQPVAPRGFGKAGRQFSAVLCHCPPYAYSAPRPRNWFRPGGGSIGGRGCLLPLKGRLPLWADASHKCFWSTPPASVDEQ